MCQPGSRARPADQSWPRGCQNRTCRIMTPVSENKKKIPVKSFLRKASCATAPLGVFAFWGGMLRAARYTPGYDWRYMPLSDLLSPSRSPSGYLWGATGIVLCGICGLFWTAILARRWKHEYEGIRPNGIRALQFGYFCMICAAVLPRWLLRIQKGHEILAALAFVGLLIGMVRLMFQTMEGILLRRMRRFSSHARLYAFIVASVAVFPILLAGLAQAYFYYVPPEFHWRSSSWRVRGWPVFLRFPFWEWVTCIVLSAYMAILFLTTSSVYPTRKTSAAR